MKTRWYKNAVFYQIYPRSFCDSDGDGIGDINGIISKLDYLKNLGINAVWLSPVYKSPNFDNGYDISDYKNIQPEFGTLDDFKNMINEMHKRDIKLVMDLVVNHSSSEHDWFTESKKSKDNPYRDYYIWRKGKGKDGKKPPNNWTSRFTGKAWTFDENTHEWYLHLFAKQQPDLNWDNPKLRKEVIDICNYWFEMGVDGFRCDVITYISKAQGLPDGKYNPIMRGDEHFVLGPNIHKYLKEINEKSWSLYDTMIVGEAIGVGAKQALSILDEKNNELDSAITFELMDVDMKMSFYPVKLKLPKFKSVMEMWQLLPSTCWPTLYLENHDQPRSTSRYGNKNGENFDKLSKMLVTMLFMQRGTPYVYQGQEIGMTNCPLDVTEYLDIMAVNIFAIMKKIPFLMPLAKKIMAKRARDHARTPMQWNNLDNAGFTSGKAWMKINPNYIDINVESQIDNSNSVLNYYKKIIEIRHDNNIIINGSFKQYLETNKDIFVYERKLESEGYIVICNFKNKNVNFNMPIELQFNESDIFISNYDNSTMKLTSITLKAYESVVYKVKY